MNSQSEAWKQKSIGIVTFESKLKSSRTLVITALLGFYSFFMLNLDLMDSSAYKANSTLNQNLLLENNSKFNVKNAKEKLYTYSFIRFHFCRI